MGAKEIKILATQRVLDDKIENDIIDAVTSVEPENPKKYILLKDVNLCFRGSLISMKRGQIVDRIEIIEVLLSCNTPMRGVA